MYAFVGGFLGGVLAGLAATAIWVGVAERRRRTFRRANFAHLEGTYSSTRKEADELETDGVRITVDGNVLNVDYHGLADGGIASGQIVMDERLPRRGEGYYWHLQGGKQLWGFYRVQVTTGRDLLVHTEWLNADTGQAEMSAYVWKRISAAIAETAHKVDLAR